MVEERTLRDETILLLAYSPWEVFRQDNEWASVWAEENRVLYVESQPRLGTSWITDPLTAARGWRSCRLTRPHRQLAICSPPPRFPWFVHLHPPVLKRWVFRLSLRLNGLGLQRLLKQALRSLDWYPSVLWCYEAHGLLLRRYFDLHWVGYRVYDEITLFPYWELIKAEYNRFEREVIGLADFVFASSQTQFEKRCSWTSRIYHLPNAGAFDRYSRYNDGCATPNRPEDLPQGGPIIMFIGTLDYRLDYDLLVRVARQNPAWQWVFVGRTKQPSAGDGPGHLSRLENVYLIGEKPPADLPDYLYFADVSVIPYRLTQSTQTMFPWKVYEHLAMGKPIVTTALPELKPLHQQLYWADDDTAFVRSIEAALSERDDERKARRIDLASQNSWSVRGREVAGIVHQETVERCHQ